MRGVVAIAAVVVLTLLTRPLGLDLSGQSSSAALPGIEELMSAKEFEGAGLRKLSADELRALNAWLRTYTQAVARTVAQGTATTSKATIPATPDLIESQIDDDFEGWEGETIFKLRNGQIWQQSSYAYAYHYAYAPKVLIYKSGGVYKMKVDGVTSEITVRRLK